MDFSTRLKELIKLGNIKMKDLAEYLCYDISYISKWVNGKMIPSEKIAEEIIDKMASYLAGRLIYLQKEDNIRKMTKRSFKIDSEYRMYKIIYSLLEDSYFLSTNQKGGSDESNQSILSIEQEEEDIVEIISLQIKKAIALSNEDVKIYCTLGKLRIVKEVLNKFGTFFITKNIKVILKCIVDENDYEIFKHIELESTYDLLSNIAFFNLEIYVKTICPFSGFIYIKDYSVTNYHLNLQGDPITCITTNNKNVLKQYDDICEAVFRDKNLMMKSRDKYLFQDRIDEYFIAKELDQIIIYLSYIEGFFLSKELLEKLLIRYNIEAREAQALRSIRNSYESIFNRDNIKFIINISRKSLIRGIRQKKLILSDRVFMLTDQEYEEYIDSVEKVLIKYNNKLKLSILEDRTFPIKIYEYGLSIIATKSYVFLKKDPNYVDKYVNGYFEVLDEDHSKYLFEKLERLQNDNFLEVLDKTELEKFKNSIEELKIII
ncbi:MAG: helix-turn-helix transcriptional regulator [Andreesenia angusta]|nr:helix-turn-helix transcriptional regulator [Andreesenia angusta]